MGHLNIVSPSTFQSILEVGAIRIGSKIGPAQSTSAPKPEQIRGLRGTIYNLLADVLAARVGDSIFPWCIDENASEGDEADNAAKKQPKAPVKRGWGFDAVFTVSGAPFLVSQDSHPIYLPVKNDYLRVDPPLSEEEAVDLWGTRLLWNAIGKKSLRRGRSLTHQTPSEDEELLARLSSAGRVVSNKKLTADPPEKVTPLRMVLTRDNDEDLHLKELCALEQSERFGKLDIARLSWVDGMHFRLEKALEGWILQEIDQPTGGTIRGALFGSPEAMPEWTANYLPFGVAGSSIDLVSLWTDGKHKGCSVVELKVKSLGGKDLEGAIQQVKAYAAYIGRALKAYEDDRSVEAVLLFGSGKTKKADSKVAAACTKAGVGFVLYKIQNDCTVEFERIV